MKKIPLLLSGLALTTTNTGLMSTLTADMERVPVTVNDSLNTIDERDEMIPLQVDIGNTLDSMTLNPFEHRRQAVLETVDTARNTLTFRFNDIASGWIPQRIIVSQMDYENGVTEVMADEGLSELTDAKSDWELRLVDRSLSAATSMGVMRPIGSYRIADNRTDILYYAIQFSKEIVDENGDKQGTETYWLRGKANYRRCGHSSIYDASSMSCYAMPDEASQAMKYVPMNQMNWILSLPEGEEIVSWDEEWQMILQEKIGAVRERLEKLQQAILGATDTLTNSGIEVEYLEKATGSSTDLGILDEVKQLKKLLEDTQKAYDELVGDTNDCPVDTKNEQLQKEIAELEKKLADYEDECQKLQDELKVKQSEMTDLKAENERLAAENADLLSKIADLERQIQENDRDNSKNEVDEANQEQTDKNTSDTSDDNSKTEDDSGSNLEVGDNMPSDVSGGVLGLVKDESAVTQPDEQDTPKTPVIFAQETNNQATSVEDVEDERVRVNENANTEVDKPSDVTKGSEVDEIEVPNLGETGLRGFFWWILAAFVGLTGVFVVWMRKIRSSKR